MQSCEGSLVNLGLILIGLGCTCNAPPPSHLVTPLQRGDHIPGLRVIQEYASPQDEASIMALVDDIMAGGGGGAVVTTLKRRVTAHYGFEFDYKLRSVNPNMPLHNMPAVVHALCSRLYRQATDGLGGSLIFDCDAASNAKYLMLPAKCLILPISANESPPGYQTNAPSTSTSPARELPTTSIPTGASFQALLSGTSSLY
jgi:hypothetical protein